MPTRVWNQTHKNKELALTRETTAAAGASV